MRLLQGSHLSLSRFHDRPPRVRSLSPVPGAAYTSANGINNLGQVVGAYGTDPSNDGQAFLRDVDGTLALFGIEGAKYTRAFGINDAGVIAGNFADGRVWVGQGCGGRIHNG